MSSGHAAVIGNGETIAHVLADKTRLALALEDASLPEEKRSEISAKLDSVNAQLDEIKAAIG